MSVDNPISKTDTDLERAGYLLQRWAQVYRGGVNVGYPSVNVIEQERARVHGSDDPPPLQIDDELAQAVDEALSRMRRQGLSGPFQVVMRYYLPREPIAMLAVAKQLGISERRAREWHAMALSFVLARVDG